MLVFPAALGPVIRFIDGENGRLALLILRKLPISSDSSPAAVANNESGDGRMVRYGDYKKQLQAHRHDHVMAVCRTWFVNQRTTIGI